MNNDAERLLRDLPSVDFDPCQFPNVFRQVDSFRLNDLFEAFEFREKKIDYFYDGDQEIQVPGTKTLFVSADRTGSIPMSEGRNVIGDRYLACHLFFVKTKDNEMYGFGTDEQGSSLTIVAIDRFVGLATSSVSKSTESKNGLMNMISNIKEYCKKISSS